ncbi:hypothetical protein ASH72_02195 [Salmonella enterica subsp. enterica serovar Kentucky]|nr:hypothetical protein [Salmonella enterica subsp. enterica serovar Kentucky]
MHASFELQQNLSPGCVYNFARKLTAKSITFLRQINIETVPLLNSLFLNCNNSREVLKNDTAWHRPRKKCYKWQFILRGIQDSHKA